MNRTFDTEKMSRLTTEDNILSSCGLPLFFEVADTVALGGANPANRHGQSVRVWARSLSVMQKEAIVLSARSGRAWRLASDEGPYLNGHDFGPCPLSFLTAGMISAYMNEILTAARQRGLVLHDLELVQHNHYAMVGSALKGTMRGSALPVDLEVSATCDADDATLRELVVDATRASPLDGLMRAQNLSLFTLSHNGIEIPAGETQVVGAAALPPPRDRFGIVRPVQESDPGWIQKLMDVSQTSSAPAPAGAGLAPEQKRNVVLKGTCRLRSDGVKEIRQEMFNPPGSTFLFLSDESEEFGGLSRAPDAVSYASAGIAFCFMTQLGRYAKIVKKNLTAYDLIQDTHFSLGGYSGGDGEPGRADPVETHVYLESDEDDAFARKCLNMAEQTCYLHALCRTALELKLSVK